MQLDLFNSLQHVVAVSGGKDSTAMALRLRELHPDRHFVYFCTPTGNEPPALFAHMDRMEQLLEAPIHRLAPRLNSEGNCVGWRLRTDNSDGLDDLIRLQNCIPNWRQRFCTRILKIEPAVFWLQEMAPCVQYVGLRADEESREGIYGEIVGVSQAHPMRDEWGWGIEEVRSYLKQRGVEVPIRSDCALCFFQRLYEWEDLLSDEPEMYAAGERIEARQGHTFRSPGRDTWPAGLAELREAFKTKKARRPRTKTACDKEALCRVCTL